jgi:hypothetical protein
MAVSRLYGSGAKLPALEADLAGSTSKQYKQYEKAVQAVQAVQPGSTSSTIRQYKQAVHLVTAARGCRRGSEAHVDMCLPVDRTWQGAAAKASLCDIQNACRHSNTVGARPYTVLPPPAMPVVSSSEQPHSL